MATHTNSRLRVNSRRKDVLERLEKIVANHIKDCQELDGRGDGSGKEPTAKLQQRVLDTARDLKRIKAEIQVLRERIDRNSSAGKFLNRTGKIADKGDKAKKEVDSLYSNKVIAVYAVTIVRSTNASRYKRNKKGRKIKQKKNKVMSLVDQFPCDKHTVREVRDMKKYQNRKSSRGSTRYVVKYVDKYKVRNK